MENSYLKRTEGKTAGDIKKKDLWKHYKKNAIHKLIDIKTYNAFTTDLLNTLSKEIVETGLEVKITNVGKFRIKSMKTNVFKKDGTLSKALRVDWKKTWEYWHKIYPEMTRDEIVKVEGKKVLFHENAHSDGEVYTHFWDNFTTGLRYKTFYKFKAARQYSRLISKVVNNPNRKVFYYG